MSHSTKVLGYAANPVVLDPENAPDLALLRPALVASKMNKSCRRATIASSRSTTVSCSTELRGIAVRPFLGGLEVPNDPAHAIDVAADDRSNRSLLNAGEPELDDHQVLQEFRDTFGLL